MPRKGAATAARKQMRDFGQLIAWYHGVQVPQGEADRPRNGIRYTLRTLDDAVRVLLYQSNRSLEIKTFGAIPTGTVMLGYMPDEIRAMEHDYFVDLAATLPRSMLITRGEGNEDILPYSPVAQIVNVSQSGTDYEADVDYEATEIGVRWLSDNQPAPGSEYFAEWDAKPVYELTAFASEVNVNDTDGTPLPRHVALTLRDTLPVE